MRQVIGVLFLAVSFLIAGLGTAAAQDWSGRWVTQGNVTNYLELTQNGTALTGTITGVDRGNLVATANGAAINGAATFANGVTYTVTGTLQNDVMQLTLTAGQVTNTVQLVRDGGQQQQQRQQVAILYYYLDSANAQFGPFDVNALRAEIGAGRMTAETLVWSAGMAGWERADAVPAVAALFRTAPPPGNAEYYLQGDTQPEGPFTYAVLADQVQTLELRRWSHVWSSEDQNWLRADERAEFRDTFPPIQPAAATAETISLPPLRPGLTPDQVKKVEMVLGATLGVLLHEFGHAIIGEIDVPATGPEEDTADQFAAMLLGSAIKPEELAGEDKETVAFLRNIVHYQTLMWRRMQESREGGDEIPWYDSHSSPSNRFGNILCVVYGASPETYQPLADFVQFPPADQQRCKLDYPRLYRAWQTIITPYMREQNDGRTGYQPADTPGGKVAVEFRPSETASGQALLPVLEESGIFQGIADLLEKNFVWPRDFRLLFADCGEANAFYSNGEVFVIMCWEGIEMFSGVLLDAERIPRR